MDFGPWRQNNIWKLLQNDSGVILESLEINLERFSDQKVNIWNIVLYINSENEGTSKADFQISSSVNESRPGTHFKMCPRS